MTVEQEHGHAPAASGGARSTRSSRRRSPSTSTGTGWTRSSCPQNIVKEGLLAIVFKGPAGFRLQSIDTGFEGIITALGGFKTDDATQPTIIATVVRYKNVFKTSGETQVIMTVPQE